MFPLKTERSSSGLIEFPSVAESVIAIMKCNHIPVENKGYYWRCYIYKKFIIYCFLTLCLGTKFPFIMKLCFSSSKSMNNAWNLEHTEKVNEDN